MKARRQLLAFTLLLAAVVSSFGQPTITVQPKSQTASLFADLTFRVTATSTQALSFQWQFNAMPIDGALTNSLTIANVLKPNAGLYSVVVSDSSGSVTSQVATLTITPFNSIYCFGFSWTDTRGIGCNWPSPQYYKGRACNGPMWPEFLSTNLGLAYVPANNYAHCGATPSDTLNQVISFPVSPKPQLSLYCLLLGTAMDITRESTWNQSIQSDFLINSNSVNRLYVKGARTIVVESQWSDDEAPGVTGYFGTNTASRLRYRDYWPRWNAAFIDGINTYIRTRPDLRLLVVDMFSKFDAVLANATQYGFTKTDIDALGDSSLTDQSFTGPGADYVYWDPLHPTSKLHALMAAWHLEALTNSILETLDVTITGGSPSIQMNHLLIGRDYTLQGSPDLSNWQDLQTFTAAAGTNRWTGASDTANGAFYRLKWQP